MITPGEARASYYWIVANSINNNSSEMSDLLNFMKAYSLQYKVNYDNLNFLIGISDVVFSDKVFVLDSYKRFISKNPDLKSKYLFNLKCILLYISYNEEDVLSVLKMYENEEGSIIYEKEEQDLVIKQKLDKLIGLQDIKQEIYNLQNLALVNLKRKKKGLKASSIAMHMVFSGSPGTGKTTVARIIGEIYYSLGVIDKKDVKEVAREDLVAEYLGQSEIKTRKVLEEAKGGVLFIDEAYSLSEQNDDYGKTVINTLLKFMEDNREDTLIIVAGYTDEINKFIKTNPGLESRFNTYLNFPNYTSEELIEILRLMISDNDYFINEKELVKVKKSIDNIDKNNKNFSNARYVRNIFEKAIKNQATRIIDINNPKKEELMTLIYDDFEF